MKSRVIAGIRTALLLVPMVLPAAAPAGQGGPNTVAEQNATKQPEISAALKHLAEAKKSLQAGSQLHGGHRLKAIQHVDQAIAEVEQAISFTSSSKARKASKLA